MKKVLSHALIVIGAALIVIAVALPVYVLPKGKVIPKDIESYTVTDETEGRLLDAAALAAGRPVGDNARKPECRGGSPTVSCFIWRDVPLQNQRHILAQEPTTDKEITLEAGNTVFRTDLPEPQNLVAATVDRV
ncbi:porin PorA family protein, partial [uncultured Corynebacterium sp.]|uniref:porin PorA family protein n=1 Tax=uncultured Corynebacterium sp. TaxID=159447 RepID=UPI0025EBE36E